MKTGPGGCTSGPVCDSYKYWNIGIGIVNGVKYCCAQNRDYGYVSLSFSNGVITCDCYRLTKDQIDEIKVKAKETIDRVKETIDLAKETIDWAKENIQKTMTALSKLFS